MDIGSEFIASYLSLRIGVMRFTTELIAPGETREEVQVFLGQVISSRTITVPEYTGTGTGTAGLSSVGAGFLFALGPSNLDLGTTWGVVFYPVGVEPFKQWGSQYELQRAGGPLVRVGVGTTDEYRHPRMGSAFLVPVLNDGYARALTAKGDEAR